MKIPFKCPVCDGAGLVSRPPHIPGDRLEYSTSTITTYPCKACLATGVVWSKDIEDETIEINEDGQIISKDPERAATF